MDDLISRQAAINKFEPWLKVEGYSEGELNMLKGVLYELRFLPSVQAELIVYCGECKHMMPNGRCEEFADDAIRPSASDYCSAGERKEE